MYTLIYNLYSGILLLGAAIAAPAPYFIAAICLLLLQTLSLALRLPLFWNLWSRLLTLLLLPLVWQSILGLILPASALPGLLAVLLDLPLILSLDSYLKQQATHQPLDAGLSGRRLTPLALVLILTPLVTLLAALLVHNPVLLATALLLLIYAALVLWQAWRSTAGQPVTCEPLEERILAGDSRHTSLKLASIHTQGLMAELQPEDSWLSLHPRRFSAVSGSTLDLRLTPPLAGRSTPSLRLALGDRRGLVRSAYSLQPLLLHIIPRARYARYLAQKFLEGSASGIEIAALTPFMETLKRTRGTDYLRSREYLPGDQLKDIDFKHRAKYGRLIFKEYASSDGRPAILAAGLTAATAEEADRLVYNLISAAFTLAQDGIPTALAVYDRQAVRQVTGLLAPRELLRQALSLADEVRILPSPARRLAPQDARRLRQTINTLESTHLSMVSGLLEVLRLQYAAIGQLSGVHPASACLDSATRRLKPPAAVLLASPLAGDDAEALSAILDKLSRRGYQVLALPSV
jgi:uncharacterized protein (DUF58 family)